MDGTRWKTEPVITLAGPDLAIARAGWGGDQPDSYMDLFYAMGYHPAPFDRDAIERVRIIAIGDPDGDDWEWLIDLGDGRRFYATGACDFTGWDCQSDMAYQEIPASAWGWRPLVAPDPEP